MKIPKKTFRYYMRESFQGGYFKGPEPAEFYKEGIIQLLPKLKPESVALVDSIAPPDFILNSALGMSDGNVGEGIGSS